MTAPRPYRALVLGIHPTARGFGWAALENPFTAFDAGLVGAKGKRKNEMCLKQLAPLLERLKPETLVLEAFDKARSQRSSRIQRLCLAIVSLAADQGMEIAIYNRADVQAAFASVGAKTRDEIAQTVLQHLPTLKVHYPGKRKLGDSEDKRLSIFSAGALALTHYHFGAADIFERLQKAA